VDPKQEARAAAVQAAASILGGNGAKVDKTPESWGTVLASQDLIELTSRIAMYIRHGIWEDDR
jgi:hypothetical protein